METPNLVLVSEDQIPSVFRKSRRDLKDLVRATTSPDREQHQEIVDQIIELTVDDIPLRDWPSDTTVRFISIICRTAQEVIEREAALLVEDQVRLQMLRRLADLLFSVTA